MSKSVKFVKLLTPIAFAVALSACGGSSGADFGSNSGTTTGTGTDTDTGTDTGTGTAEELVYTLQPLQIGLSSLSAGGSTGITTRLVDQNGDFANVTQTVSFTSPCIANGTSEVVSPVVSSNGVFTSTYTAKGCEGSDTITASVDGLSVDGTVNVQAANLGSVEFISAAPQNILLSGMSAPGFGHTSTVRFQILNDVGGPIANEDVTFGLSTEVGGIGLATTVGKTDNQGFVSTIVRAGTVNTPVRVKATVTRGNTTISSESSQLVISTGIADQNSLSLSLETLNPQAWNHDGVKVGVNIYAADRYNNPVPDGTVVSFYTELGQIEPSCQTEAGACVVQWTSSNPRDLGTLNVDYPRDSITSNSDGITTITAVVIGEESFIDTNSNGVFDDGDELLAQSDRGDAFENYNMGYDSAGDDIEGWNQGLEPFLDFNSNGVRDTRDGLYTGLGCQHSTLCAPDQGLKNIFRSVQLVMSEDFYNVRVYDAGVQVFALENNKSYDVEVSGVTNNQVPYAGASLSATSDVAKVVVGSDTVPSTNQHSRQLTSPAGNYTFPVFLEDKDPLEFETGFVKITLDGGRSFLFNYQDTPVPSGP